MINTILAIFLTKCFTRRAGAAPLRGLFERFQQLDQRNLTSAGTAVDAAFLRQGITFTVYSDEQGTERIFPFDLMPRIIPEWRVDQIESGLIQRMQALNLFLKDIYPTSAS